MRIYTIANSLTVISSKISVKGKHLILDEWGVFAVFSY